MVIMATLAAAATAVLVALPSIVNGFVYDDVWIVQDREVVHSLRPLGELLAAPFWPEARGGYMWRPTTLFAFAGQWVVGGGSPAVFHAVSVVLYGMVSGLVALLGAWLFAPTVGLLAGILFAVHPVHVEVTANVVGQAELLAALGYLVALVAVRYPRRRRVRGRRSTRVARVDCSDGRDRGVSRASGAVCAFCDGRGRPGAWIGPHLHVRPGSDHASGVARVATAAVPTVPTLGGLFPAAPGARPIVRADARRCRHDVACGGRGGVEAAGPVARGLRRRGHVRCDDHCPVGSVAGRTAVVSSVRGLGVGHRWLLRRNSISRRIGLEAHRNGGCRDGCARVCGTERGTRRRLAHQRYVLSSTPPRCARLVSGPLGYWRHGVRTRGQHHRRARDAYRCKAVSGQCGLAA